MSDDETELGRIAAALTAVLDGQTPDLKRKAMHMVFSGALRDLLQTHDLAVALQALLGAAGVAIAAVLPHGIHCESVNRDDADDKTRAIVDACYVAMNQAIEHSGVGFKPVTDTNHEPLGELPFASLNDLTAVQRETAELLAMRDLRLLAAYLRVVLGPRKLSPSRIVDALLAGALERMPHGDPKAPQIFAVMVSAVTSNVGREMPDARPGDLVRVQVPPNCVITDADARRVARIRAIAAELGMVHRTAAEMLREQMKAKLPPEKYGWVGPPYPHQSVDGQHLNVMLAELADLTVDDSVWPAAGSNAKEGADAAT